MSKLQKAKNKLLNTNQVFTIQELDYLLKQLDYSEKMTGKTSGSRLAYIHSNTKHIIRLHKPHPGKELKKYMRQYVIDELKNQGLL
ncbi:MAG: type II toxin-antitoxin system HicA family toxin [Balneolaceae bacterium]|nr:type II toxin-antitoxin system HicA family toxin [Balneolaceae bacterium]MDR9446769.1 type II toxin-antitoxin system HicA family toxin [Balneolaceae bacterium]